MDDPARWEPIRGELFWAFPEEGPTERIEHPPHPGIAPRHELIEDDEHDEWPASVWPTEDREEEYPVQEPAVLEDPVDWIASWRENDEATPIMSAVLADTLQDDDAGEVAA